VYQTADPSHGGGQCISSVMGSSFSNSTSSLALNILGVAFFKSVLAVFDFGVNEIRLAKLEGEVVEGAGQNGTGGGSGSGSGPATPATGNSAASSQRGLAVWTCFMLMASVAGVSMGLF
jgi:hypothetical protein